MRTMKRYSVWRRKTIERAVSILRLIQITRAPKDVELRSLVRECPECHRPVEVIVLPERVCSECWSRRVIAAWRVLPVRVGMARRNAGYAGKVGNGKNRHSIKTGPPPRYVLGARTRTALRTVGSSAPEVERCP